MEVILLEGVRKLGQLGDVIKVKPGYARNYLIPQGKAIYATTANMAVFDAKREDLNAQAKARLSTAQAKACKLDGVAVEIQVRASEEGNLYGSVGPGEICSAIVEKLGIELEKKDVHLPHGPIRALGEVQVMVHLHNDVVQPIHVTITSV